MLEYSTPNPNSKSVIADWVELYISFQNCGISKSQLSSFIEASKGVEPNESFLNDIWDELIFRQTLYGDFPPFSIEYDYIECLIDWTKSPEYVTCLIYALEGNPNTNTSSAAVAGKYFERISNEAVRSYISGNSIVYGFPNEQDIANVAKDLLCEKFIYYPPSYRKDRDLDIIAWKPWGDRRSSQLIFFVQCAAGSNWKTKLKDLNVRAWEKYIHVAAKIVKGFSIPIIISDIEELHEISTDAGIIIDRTRIFKETINNNFEDTDLRPTLVNWCKNRIIEITE